MPGTRAEGIFTGTKSCGYILPGYENFSLLFTGLPKRFAINPDKCEAWKLANLRTEKKQAKQKQKTHILLSSCNI